MRNYPNLDLFASRYFFREFRREASARDVSVIAKLIVYIIFRIFHLGERAGGSFSGHGGGTWDGGRGLWHRVCSPWVPVLFTLGPFFEALSSRSAVVPLLLLPCI